MPLPTAIAAVIFILVFLIYVGGRLYLIAIALLVYAYKHLSTQYKIIGKWKIDTKILIVYLIVITFFIFIILFFPFFPINFSNMIKISLSILGACCYSFIISLKKL